MNKNTKAIERADLLRENMAKVRRWPARLKKLANRKEGSLSERAFCERHGLSIWVFNRAKNGATQPKPKTIETVEAAFEAEGV